MIRGIAARLSRPHAEKPFIADWRSPRREGEAYASRRAAMARWRRRARTREHAFLATRPRH